jgi:hypothetical protein
MKQIASKRALGIFTWVLLLVAVPTGLYVSHVFNQLSEVRNNNLRTLSKAAESTTQAFATILQNVRNLQNHDDFVCDFLKRQPYLEGAGSGGCVRKQGAGRFSDAYLRGDNAGVRVIVGAADSAKGYTFDVNLDALLKAIPFNEALDLLVIADEDGDVIHQHRPQGRLDTGLRLGSLAGLPTGVEGNVTQKEGLTRSSSVSRVNLSGTDYQLLCQPIVLDLGISGEEKLPQDVDTKAGEEAENAGEGAAKAGEGAAGEGARGKVADLGALRPGGKRTRAAGIAGRRAVPGAHFSRDHRVRLPHLAGAQTDLD